MKLAPPSLYARSRLQPKRLVKDQSGLASIIIVTAIITVVTLIVLGFAGIIRREQQQALDKHLTAQAKLAAEAVVNEKIAQFRADPASIYAATSGCTDQGATFEGDTYVQTTCVQINPTPGRLEYGEVPTDTSMIIWLDPEGKQVNRLIITWQNSRTASGHDCMTTPYTNLPTSISGNTIGLLRFDLTRIGNGSFTRDTLKSNAFGGILYPRSSSPNTASYTWNPNPTVQPVTFGACGTTPAGLTSSDEPLKAHATINLNNSTARHVLRLRGVYRAPDVNIFGIETGTNRIIEFKDSQVLIEATTRVGDVVQRVQARVPASTPPRELLPDEAIHVTSGGLCKLLQTEPNSTTSGC